MSSTSQIIVDPMNFMSSTQTDVVLRDLAYDRGMLKVHENMTVIFDSVAPAKGLIPKITDPVSTGIITGKWLQRNSSATFYH